MPVADNNQSFMESRQTSDATKDARIVNLLVSAGYLESSASAAALQGNMVSEIPLQITTKLLEKR